MEKSQAEFLSDRIKHVASPDNKYGYDREKALKAEPARVTAARKTLADYEATQEKLRSTQMAIFRKARHTAQEALHAGNYAEALVAVQNFERQYGCDN